MRRQAMNMREELGLGWKEIAAVVGVHISTVLGWSKRYEMEGSAGLKSKQRGRRYRSGRTLTLAQEWQLRTLIVGRNPNQFQLDFALWNRRAVMELIKTLFDIDMPIRTVGEYLLRWGYTPQRPIKRALEQNPETVERWLKETYPSIASGPRLRGPRFTGAMKRLLPKTDTGFVGMHRQARLPSWLRRPSVTDSP